MGPIRVHRCQLSRLQQVEAPLKLSIGLRVFRLCSLVMCTASGAMAAAFLRERTLLLHRHVSNQLSAAGHEIAWQKYEDALIAGEDHRYRHHFGLDPIAVLRAAVKTYGFGSRQGGSTIEQQLTRTLTGDYRPAITRKVSEALLASTLYGRFTKSELSCAYLASAHFGYGMRGLRAALGRIHTPDEIAGLSVPFVIAHLKYPLREQPCALDVAKRIARAKHIARRAGAGRGRDVW